MVLVHFYDSCFVRRTLYGSQARFFEDELHTDLKHGKVGVVGMAGAGKDMNASQFYITLGTNLDSLDGKHTIFGEVSLVPLMACWMLMSRGCS